MHSEKVPYFILDLLQQVPSVYVHGLGRFDAIFHPAVIDLHHSHIKPPYIEPGFVVKDENPGDLLPLYMHYVSGTSKEDAIEGINDFVVLVRQQIESGDSYTIERFGTFSKSPSGVLHFTPDWDAFNLSFNGLETIQIEPETVAKEYTPPHPISISPIDEPEPIVSTVDNFYDTSETNWVTDKETEVPPAPVEVEPIKENTEISDSTSRLWWIILMLALVLITVLCAYLAWDILSNRRRLQQLTQVYPDTTSSTTSKTPVEIITLPDTVSKPNQSDTSKVISLKTTTQPQETKPDPVITEEKPCFVVVGAFSNPNNVIRMVERLEGLGYAVEQIKGGSLTRVAIRTACDQQTLQKILSEARSNINPEAWIY